MHFQSIRYGGILYSIFQEKKCVLWPGKYSTVFYCTVFDLSQFKEMNVLFRIILTKEVSEAIVF